jgi:hypothetical protein
MRHFENAEQFFESLTVLPSGCKEGPVIYARKYQRPELRRIAGSSVSLKILTGEMMYHRAAFKLAYPDVDIKNKSLTSKCQNTACCNPEHLMVGLSRV